MSFHLLLVRTQELRFIALPVAGVRAGPFPGISLSVHKLLCPGLPEILLPFKKGNKAPCTSCFELLLLLRCLCVWAVRAAASAHRTGHLFGMLHPCCCGHRASQVTYNHLLLAVHMPNRSSVGVNQTTAPCGVPVSLPCAVCIRVGRCPAGAPAAVQACGARSGDVQPAQIHAPCAWWLPGSTGFLEKEKQFLKRSSQMEN